ncbi:MAG TPA: hypothetical protein VJ813_19630 [Vicinamibacterales bacterium]|nr:hypothetical protein [Vicinamibacterales bacterium]
MLRRRPQDVASRGAEGHAAKGVKSRKRARQYEHIKESAKKTGRSTKRAKQIAAATVNKQRRQAGETKRSRKSSGRKSSGGKKR